MKHVYSLLLAFTLILFAQPPSHSGALAQRPGTGMNVEKENKRKPHVPDNPERAEKTKKEKGDKLSSADNTAPEEEQKQEPKSRRWWKKFFKTKKSEYNEHHDRIQTKEVRKRMKANAKKSKNINKNKKPPFWKTMGNKKRR
jgi:hypothetical protein